MSQANFTPISLYYSTTASAVPTAANLVPGELAINTNDGKLYYEDSSGVVQVLATKSTGLIGGSNTQVQFNNSGSLGGSSSFTWDGSFLTTSSIKNSALTSGRVTYAGASGLLTDSANLLYSGTDLTVYGLTVGRGLAGVSTNTAVGASALSANTSGNLNTALGFEALKLNTSGAENVAVGYRALDANLGGTNNIAMGRNALGSNTSGSANVAVGDSALIGNLTANNNSAFGNDALGTNSTGANNTAIGHSALASNTTASSNTAVGYQASYTLAGAGNQNVTVGQQAGYGSQASTTNVFVGYQAGYYNTTGNSNIMIGSQAGALNVAADTGDGNVYIGAGVRGSAAGNATEIVIGYLTTGKGSSTGFINPNSGGVYQGNNSLSWSITSDQRLKKNIVDNNTGLDKITQIQVRNFEYRLETEITELPQNQAIKKEGIQLGVIAQELQKILPECVKTESTGVMTVDADNLTWYMVNAIKELKAEVDSLK